MVVESLCNVFFLILQGMISTIQITNTLPSWAMNTISLLGTALFFFPVDVWAVFIGNVVTWTGIQYGWAIIEWIYKKIPGVN